jgi:hypothetical protein
VIHGRLEAVVKDRLEIPGHGLWAIEIKLGLHSRPRPGFRIACEDLRPVKRFVVNSGHERQPIAPETESIGLRQLAIPSGRNTLRFASAFRAGGTAYPTFIFTRVRGQRGHWERLER